MDILQETKKTFDFSKLRKKSEISFAYYGSVATSRKNMKSIAKALVKTNLKDKLECISIPTLILHPEHDEIYSDRSYLILHNKIKHSELKELEGNHNFSLKHQKSFENNILEFLKKR